MQKIECEIRVSVAHLPALPPEPVAVDVGLQTKKKEVLTGAKGDQGGLVFETVMEVLIRDGNVDFKGICVHGPPTGRFLYLSWKRRREEPPLWVQRVKIPLDATLPLFEDIGQATKASLSVDVTGREPHEMTPLHWSIELF